MSLIKLEEKDESPLVNAFKSVTACQRVKVNVSQEIFFKAEKPSGAVCVSRVWKQGWGSNVFVLIEGGLNYQYWRCQVLD